MTNQELIKSIEEKIQGQGNQVDLGGVLSEILKALVSGKIDASSIAPEFVEGSPYNKGDVVTHDGMLYAFEDDYDGGAWEDAAVTEAYVQNVTQNIVHNSEDFIGSAELSDDAKTELIDIYTKGKNIFPTIIREDDGTTFNVIAMYKENDDLTVAIYHPGESVIPYYVATL